MCPKDGGDTQYGWYEAASVTMTCVLEPSQYVILLTSMRSNPTPTTSSELHPC
jgi:hypothetical protein